MKKRPPPARGRTSSEQTGSPASAARRRNEGYFDELVKAENKRHPLVEAFCSLTILHKRLIQLLGLLARTLHDAPPGSVVLVLGPTGVGKSTLIRRFATEVLNAVKRTGASAYRIVLVELFAPERGPFDWSTGLYEPVLNALKEPCLDCKIDVSAIVPDSPPRGRPPMGRNTVARRDLFVKVLEERSVHLVAIDDAHHIRAGGSGASIFDRYRTLKSLAGASRTRFLLLGTSEIKEILRQSGQLSRRVIPLFFFPYTESQADLEAYGAGVKAIEEALPLKLGFDSDARLMDLHRGSLGEIGLTHEWFQRALAFALDRGARRISWRHMQATALTVEQITNIGREIRELKAYLSSIRTDELPIEPMEQAAKTAKPSRRRVGKRNPSRDPVPGRKR